MYLIRYRLNGMDKSIREAEENVDACVANLEVCGATDIRIYIRPTELTTSSH